VNNNAQTIEIIRTKASIEKNKFRPIWDCEL